MNLSRILVIYLAGACHNTVQLQAPLWYIDADRDGHGAFDADGDGLEDPGQRDFDPAANLGPGPWVRNNLDCDDTDQTVTSTAWMPDKDDDGYPGLATLMDTVYSCGKVDEYVIFNGAVDCADDDATIHPGHVESCNGVDDDCDGLEDSPDEAAWCDGDGDGWGAGEEVTCGATCAAVTRNGDCDDGDAAFYPGAPEVCGGGDNDCDGEPAIIPTWYLDNDGDGHGEPDEALAACNPPDGYVADSSDCDDTYEGTYPGAPEQCDGRDNDCDAVIDEGWPLLAFYMDSDRDGYGADEIRACKIPPSGYVDLPGDCDDRNDTVHPGANETCNGADDDCDGPVDEEAADAATWYADTDTDGYGISLVSTVSCTQPAGYVNDATDCDDANADVHPGISESCNGVDDDCDGSTDEDSIDLRTWYLDEDGDGYGSPRYTIQACDRPTDYLEDRTDCDDGDPDVHPGATEYCDGLDDDCDGSIDEDAADPTHWYIDLDGDGYGDPLATGSEACDPPAGQAASSSDCNDTNPWVHPEAAEYCNGIDDDCDGTTDEDALNQSNWYVDTDGDGFGSSQFTTRACERPTGYVEAGSDCDDADAAVNPEAPEMVGDGRDEDCDGREICFDDADDDGFIRLDASTRGSTDSDCDDPNEGTDTDPGNDCNDTDAAVNPGATEVCGNGMDDDCDGSGMPCMLDGTVDLSLTDAKLVGDAYYSGVYVAGAGDVNGDGFADILVADQYTYLLHGPITADLDLSFADVTLTGGYANAVSGAGDVNGDGFADILVGVPLDDEGGTQAGAAFLFLGPITADRDLSLADVKLVGEDVGDYAGESVAGAGDVNGDGFEDILVGTSQNHEGGVDAGAAYLLYGPVTANRDLSLADAKLVSESAEEHAGESVAGAGDVDGDGFADILVGADGNDEGGTAAGAAYFLCGPVMAGGSLSDANVKLVGEDPGDQAGFPVSGAGDVNGDGLDDILVGAAYNDEGGSNAGAAYLLYGPVTANRDLSLADAKLVGEEIGDNAGEFVSGAGDVNADGFSDVLVGADWNSVGAAYLLYGGTW